MKQAMSQVQKKKEYPAVGKYTIELKYDGDTFKQKVEVKDTKAPEVTAPENIEILQGTDLNTLILNHCCQLSEFLLKLSDYTFDLSGIDANVPGEYTLKASIQDKYENKTEKDIKVTVTAPLAVASDEVVVQEEVTNPDGTKSIKNTVKKKTDSGGNKVVSSGSGSSGGTGSSNSSGTAGGNSGTTGGNTGGSNKPSGGGSTGGNSGGSSSGGSSSGGNTGGSSGQEAQVEAVKINRFNRRKYGFTGLNANTVVLGQSQLFHQEMQSINQKATIAVQATQWVNIEDIAMVGMKSSFKYV